MNICMLTKLQLDTAECLKMKDLTCAFAVFIVRVFVFCKKEASDKKQQRSSNKTYTYHCTLIPQILILGIFWGLTSTTKQSRHCLGFVHRHKLEHGTKIWQLSHIDLPTLRARSPRRRGKRKEYLPLPSPLLFLG